MNSKTILGHGALALALMFAGRCPANAQIALWTFETSQPSVTGATAGPFAAEVGTGTAMGVHASAATVYSSPAGNGSSHSFSSNTWGIGDYYQFQVSTLGVSGILVEWDQTRSATGPATFDFQYSTDGTNFTTFLAGYSPLINAAPQTPWSLAAGRQSNYTFDEDLSAVTALNNTAAVYFRITADVAGAAAGTNRVDNFSVSTVPEPTSLILTGLGLVSIAGAGWRRRKTAATMV